MSLDEVERRIKQLEAELAQDEDEVRISTGSKRRREQRGGRVVVENTTRQQRARWENEDDVGELTNNASTKEDDGEQDDELQPIAHLPATLLPLPGLYNTDGSRLTKIVRSRKLMPPETLVNEQPRKAKTCDACHTTYYTKEAFQKHVRSIQHRQNVVLMAGAAYAPLQHTANYCKQCGVGFASVEEFMAHRETNEHMSKSHNVQRASFCPLCKRQFTSPLQMREHVKGKLHMEEMAKKKNTRHGPLNGGIDGKMNAR